MIILLCFLIQFHQGATEAQVDFSHFSEIPITVVNTWQLPYASEISDLGFDWQSQTLIIRSNSDGKLFLADPNNCEYIGEVDLPEGSTGFGVAKVQGEYYINSDTAPFILHSDETGTWAVFSNPAGMAGAGMESCNYTDMLFEASSTNPYQFYGIEPDGSDFYSCALPGVSSEVSGFTTHDLPTLHDQPFAVILTTRLDREFFFYLQSGGEYIQYGQEPCPVPVSESLGLTWTSSLNFYWSYIGTDGQYYISELQIPLFGGIEDGPEGLLPKPCALSIMSNPSTGSANLAVNLSQPVSASLCVFDLSGRLTAVLQSGQLASGESIFGFTGCPGMYTALLRYPGHEERLRFVLTR